MKQRLKKFATTALFALMATSAFSHAQTLGSVNLRATISPTGSGPEHWTVVWVTNADTGAFVRTIWKQGPKYKDHWSDHCDSWYNAVADDVTNYTVAADGFTGATAEDYTPPDSPIIQSWNCEDVGGNTIPDGNYKLWIQYSEDDEYSAGPVTINGLAWTKGPSGSTVTPANQGSLFTSMSIVWTPAVVPMPEIAVEQPVSSDIADGGSKDFGSVTLGANASLTFTIRNTGTADLTGLTITKDGSQPGDFMIISSPTAPVSGPSGTATFTVEFQPTAAGARTAVIHIASNDGDEGDFDITLSGTGVSVYDAWAITAGLSPAQSGPLLTPFDDGVANLVKFAFNLDPTGPDSHTLSVGEFETAGLPDSIMEGSNLKLEYIRRKADRMPGIIYTVQVSSDLSGWVLSTASETVTSINAAWERVVIVEPSPPGAMLRFVRLKVTQNP